MVLDVDRYEVLKAVKLINNEAILRLNKVFPGIVDVCTCFVLLILKGGKLVVLRLHAKVSDHNEEISQVVNVCSHILPSWDELGGSDLRLISVNYPYFRVLFGVRVNNQKFSILGNPDVNIVSGVSVNED